MDTRYIIDSNIIIYLLKGLLPEQAKEQLESILEQECNLSIISKIEVLGWNFSSKENEEIAKDFMD